MEHLRPFLAPLYAWGAAVNARSAQLPEAVALSLSYIKYMLESGISSQRVLRHVPMQHELFRADAKAEGEEIWIGGWCVAASADLSRCRWFSEKLNRQNASWAFLAGEPFRAIASLEMLATLVGLVVFGLGAEGRASLSCSASTDNLGNTCVLRRWLTTKYPLSCFVMEIAALLAKANVELNLLWLPRLQNVEADALTNSDYRGFNPDLRQKFCLEEYDGLVLKQMLAAGEELNSEVKSRPQEETKVCHQGQDDPFKSARSLGRPMSRITELPAPWTACGALRMGKYCLRSSCCACQAFRPYACMPACICCCLCLHLPICSRKECPLLPLRAVLHELVHVFCFAKFPLE